jgi:ribosomal protein S18 acetylase RimI-like enzyme
MSETAKILVRNARDQDMLAVVEIDFEAFSPSGTAEKPETFSQRLRVFPNGFIILVADNEIAAYGCSEKWLAEREPGRDEDPMKTHQPDGRIFFISGMAVRTNQRGKGYGLRILDKLMEIAHNEGCRQIIVETANAQDLYLKRGFQKVRSRMQGGISLDVMSLDIESYGGKA